MKKIYIVANWKSYKTASEALDWLREMKDINLKPGKNKEVIVCPPFTFLPAMSAFIKENNLTIKLGTQNISNFAEGAYTGEINTRQAAEFVHYSIVGHSERRRLFHETDEDVMEKIKQLIENSFTPILCISDMAQLDHYLAESNLLVDNADKIIFVYEPPGAISGGGAFHPEKPEIANEKTAEISKKVGKRVITLYGGSVNPDNIVSLFGQEYIDGGLVGQASLDAVKFSTIIQKT